jgi:hypothetical protein
MDKLAAHGIDKRPTAHDKSVVCTMCGCCLTCNSMKLKLHVVGINCADDHPQRQAFVKDAAGSKTAACIMGKNSNAKLTKEAEEASTSGTRERGVYGSGMLGGVDRRGVELVDREHSTAMAPGASSHTATPMSGAGIRAHMDRKLGADECLHIDETFARWVFAEGLAFFV